MAPCGLVPVAVEQACLGLEALLERAVWQLDAACPPEAGPPARPGLPDLACLPGTGDQHAGDAEDWQALRVGLGLSQQAPAETPDLPDLTSLALNLVATGLRDAPRPARPQSLPADLVWSLALTSAGTRPAAATRAARLNRWLSRRVLGLGRLPLLDPTHPATLALLAQLVLQADGVAAPAQSDLQAQFARWGGAAALGFADQFLCCELARALALFATTPPASEHPLALLPLSGAPRYDFARHRPRRDLVPPTFHPDLFPIEKASA